jgi:hypothetical protein
MSFKFNALTGKLDLSESSSAAGLTRQQVISSILLDKDESLPPTAPYLQILFDEDSILFGDDDAL